MQGGEERERRFINLVLPSSHLSSLFLVSNDWTSKWKEYNVSTNILLYLRKCKFGEKVFKILIEFGKYFQRKEKKMTLKTFLP